jgi:hypothetical protein
VAQVLLAVLVLVMAGCKQAPQRVDAERVWFVQLSEPAYPFIGIDESVFDEPGRLGALAEHHLACRNHKTGPYYRIQTAPRKTGPVNAITAKVFLPATSSAKGLFRWVWNLYR